MTNHIDIWSRYTIEVRQEAAGPPRTYIIRAHTIDDAMQLAFALDGGWGNNDDTQMGGIMRFDLSHPDHFEAARSCCTLIRCEVIPQ